MLNQNQYTKLQKSGLSPNQMNQVISAAGGYEKPKTVGGFFGNVGKSGLKTAGGIVSSVANVFNPDMQKNTVANVARLGIGTAQLLDPTQVLGTGQEQTARNVGSFYNQRYGISDLAQGKFGSAGKKIGNTLYNDPVGAALDASTVLSGVGGLTKGLGSLAESSTLGRVGNVFSKAAEFTDPLQLVGKGVGRVTKGLPNKVGSALENQGELTMTRGLGNPKQLGKVKGVAGRSPGQLMKDYNVFDRSPEGIAQGVDQAASLYDEALIASKSPVSTAKLMKDIDQKIAKLDAESLLSETAASQRDALIARKAKLEEFLGGEKNGVRLVFSPQTAKAMKSKIYKDVKPSTFNPAYQGSGSQLAAKDIYQGLIGAIDESAPGTRQLGRDQAALIQLEDIAKAAENRGQARNLVSLPKMVSGGAGASVMGLPGMVGGMILESVANSPQGTRAMSGVLDTSGKLMKGAKVPKNVFQASKGIYQSGKLGNQLTSRESLPIMPQPPSKTPQQVVPSYPPSILPASPVPSTPSIPIKAKYKKIAQRNTIQYFKPKTRLGMR